MENSSLSIGKTIPKKEVKNLLKQSFDRSIETVGIRFKEDYFKITSLAGKN
jgi:hypothetical protein